MSSSRIVRSNQPDLHPKLAVTVRRHLTRPYRKPFAAHTEAAFRSVAERVERHAGPLLLDAGCGVGESSLRLARAHPQALVIGVDKSAHRLARAAGSMSNCVLLRADLEDFWRLAQQAGWRLWRHYLLYPNPWPKAAHLQRRWHGSALFPTILALGGRLELRSNWPLYVREFAAALALAGVSESAVEVAALGATPPLTPFERKYAATGQPLWYCSAAL